MPLSKIEQSSVNSGVAGTGPAFRATNSNSQSISSDTATKVVLNVETFDTANSFDNVTNNRFQPSVAGYYQLNGNVLFYGGGSGANLAYAMIYKNGSLYSGVLGLYNVGNGTNSVPISDIVYLNGTTDYVELWGRCIGTSISIYASYASSNTYFSGSLVRSA